jgi:hypothetical protein
MAPYPTAEATRFMALARISANEIAKPFREKSCTDENKQRYRRNALDFVRFQVSNLEQAKRSSPTARFTTVLGITTMLGVAAI